MVVHILSLGLMGAIAYLARPGTDLFSWHPTLMATGFGLLMVQAIVVFSPESSLILSSDRSSKIQLHWILNLFAMFAIGGGFGSIYLNKVIAEKPHFTTWHSKFGLAAVLTILLSAVLGLAAKYSTTFRNYVKPINLKLYHATIALIAFTLGMVTMCLACYSNWFKNRVDGYLWRLMFYTPIVLAVCIARQITQSYLPRVATPTTGSSSLQQTSSQHKASKHQQPPSKKSSKLKR